MIALALALAGCGGTTASQPEPLTAAEQEVADGYLALMRAFADGRYRDFCAGLSPESLKVTSRNVMGVPMSCPEWAEENAQIVGDLLQDRFEGARVDAVHIDGDEATLELSVKEAELRSTETVEAVRTGGRWRYTAVTASP